MNKKFILLVVFVSLVSYSFAQGIRFEEQLTWPQVQQKAKAENKLIFIDAFTTWCGPCKEMSDKTFPDREVGKVVNSQFIALKVQMDQTPKDNAQVKSWYSTAKDFLSGYEINAFPTVLFLTPEGKLVHRLVGMADANALISEVNKAIAINGAYGALVNKFNSGKMDTVEMRNLVNRAREIEDRPMMIRVSDAYIKLIKPGDLLKKSNILFAATAFHSKGRYYELFKNRRKEINKVIRNNYAELVWMGMIYHEEIEPYEKSGRPDWDFIEKCVASRYGALGQEQVWSSRTVYYHAKNDWLNFGKYYKKYFDRAVPAQRSMLHINNMSWPVFEHVTDSAVLNTAIKAMAYNVDKFQRYDPAGIDTYANLLYKANLLYGIGKREDALFWAELGVRLTDHDKSFEETLVKMKNGEKNWLEK